MPATSVFSALSNTLHMKIIVSEVPDEVSLHPDCSVNLCKKQNFIWTAIGVLVTKCILTNTHPACLQSYSGWKM